MGIRVHKVVGYGLADIKCENDEIVDERLNEKFNSEEFDNLLYETTIKDFVDFVFANKLKIFELYRNETREVSNENDASFHFFHFDILKESKKILKSEINETFIHKESSLNNVMLFVPPSQITSWKRYDDIIDWIEEDFEDRIEFLNKKCPSGIYPYDGGLVRFQKVQKESTLCDKNFLTSTDKNFLKFHSNQETKNDIENNFRPSVPIEVVALILYLDIFKNPKEIIDALRPMLYVYWS